jgi:hypothetical protein
MTRVVQVIVLAAAVLAVFHSAASAGVVPLGVSLGTPLPFAGGGLLAIAAAAVVTGIFIKRRRR